MINLYPIFRKRGCTAALIILVLLVVCVLLARWYTTRNYSPWFGRGANLSVIPYNVIVGPVDASKGIPGLLEIGMQRQEVRKRLGRPLVQRLTAKEAAREGFEDPDDVDSDYYDGIFAWVHYGNEYRVISITFDLFAFAKKFHGNQQVLLQHHGHTYLLHNNLSQEDTLAMFREQSAASDITVQGSTVLIRGSGTSLQIRDGKLGSVTIIAL